MRLGRYLNKVNGLTYVVTDEVVHADDKDMKYVTYHNESTGIKYTLGLEEFNKRFNYIGNLHTIIPVGKKYKHIKSGNIYFVIDIVTNATNGAGNALMVQYRPDDSKNVYVREVAEFCQKFEQIDSEQIDCEEEVQK